VYSLDTIEVYKMTTFTFKMNDTDIQAGIKSIGVRQRSIRVDIQKLVVSITLNWAAGGAVNVCSQRMTELMDEVDGSHTQKIVNWANAFCAFTLEENDDTGAKYLAYASDKTKLTKEEWATAKDNNVFDFTPDEPPKAVEDMAKFGAFIASLEKRAAITERALRLTFNGKT
jgi:hypothetical protein